MKPAEVRVAGALPAISQRGATWSRAYADLRPNILPTGHVHITENQVVVSACAAVRLRENDARRPIYPI